MLQNNLEANQVKIGEALSPSPLNPVVDGAYLVRAGCSRQRGM